MPLSLGRCGMSFTVDATLEDAIYRTARLALYDLAQDTVDEIADAPATPEDTGALKDSMRVAPPGYSQDDTPLVVRAGRTGDANDVPLSLNRSATRSQTATVAQRMAGHRGVLIAGGDPGPFTGDASEFVVDDGQRIHTWVGSWVYYAWWVHQGYYNVIAGRNLPGRPYITQVAQPKMQEFPAYFRRRWVETRFGGA